MKLTFHLLFGLSLLAATTVAAEKLAPELVAAEPDRPVDIIVKFSPPPTDQTLRRVQARGARHKRCLDLIGASVMSVRGRDLALLATDPEELRKLL